LRDQKESGDGQKIEERSSSSRARSSKIRRVEFTAAENVEGKKKGSKVKKSS